MLSDAVFAGVGLGDVLMTGYCYFVAVVIPSSNVPMRESGGKGRGAWKDRKGVSLGRRMRADSGSKDLVIAGTVMGRCYSRFMLQPFFHSDRIN